MTEHASLQLTKPIEEHIQIPNDINLEVHLKALSLIDADSLKETFVAAKESINVMLEWHRRQQEVKETTENSTIIGMLEKLLLLTNKQGEYIEMKIENLKLEREVLLNVNAKLAE